MITNKVCVDSFYKSQGWTRPKCKQTMITPDQLTNKSANLIVITNNIITPVPKVKKRFRGWFWPK